MEFWEGAVLLVGGIWLVGRVHNRTMRNQTNYLGSSAPVGTPSHRVPGPTSETNTSGSGFVVAGESLSTGLTGNVQSVGCPGCGSGLSAIVSRAARPAAPVRRPMAVQF